MEPLALRLAWMTFAVLAVRPGGAGVSRLRMHAQPPVRARWGDPDAIAKSAPGVRTPTERGMPVDAKRIVNQDDVAAMWLSHLLVDTQAMADVLMQEIKGGADFAMLARSSSACEETRNKGGAVGWVSRDEDEPWVDALVPGSVQAEAFNRKPGDIFLAPSARGVHIVRIDDVLMRLRADIVGRRRLSGKGHDLTNLVEAWQGAKTAQLTYEVVTMGCQMNAADSERMAGSLEALGFTALQGKQAGDPADTSPKASGKADIVVVNTCSIRDHAEQKVYSVLGPYTKRKRAGQPVGIIVAGCVAQQEGARLLRRVPEVDVVMGPQYANKLGDLLEDALNGNQVVATEPTFIMEDVTKPRRGSSVCAWVNVIYGCNERCAADVVDSLHHPRPRLPANKLSSSRAAKAHGRPCAHRAHTHTGVHTASCRARVGLSRADPWIPSSRRWRTSPGRATRR